MMAAICCTVGLAAQAQFTISGTVHDAKKNEALIGAAIQLQDQSRAALTDEQGRFELKNVKAGKHVLTVRFLGYAEGKKRSGSIRRSSAGFLA